MWLESDKLYHFYFFTLGKLNCLLFLSLLSPIQTSNKKFNWTMLAQIISLSVLIFMNRQQPYRTKKMNLTYFVASKGTQTRKSRNRLKIRPLKIIPFIVPRTQSAAPNPSINQCLLNNSCKNMIFSKSFYFRSSRICE